MFSSIVGYNRCPGGTLIVLLPRLLQRSSLDKMLFNLGFVTAFLSQFDYFVTLGEWHQDSADSHSNVSA